MSHTDRSRKLAPTGYNGFRSGELDGSLGSLVLRIDFFQASL